MLLTTPYTHEEVEEEGAIRNSYNFHPAILRINKKVHYEASGVFYRGNTWIVVHVYGQGLPKFGDAIEVPWMLVDGDEMDSKRFDDDVKLAAYSLTLSTPVSKKLTGTAATEVVTFVTNIERLREVLLWLWLLCARTAVRLGDGLPMLDLEISNGQHVVPDDRRRGILDALSA
ncbi:MAG: hypothetical protein Q9164_006667, partial [Protoblastenia rupestris]